MSLPIFKPLPPPRPGVILDFDCECRPLNWIGGDYVGKELTAIAWATISNSRPHLPVPKSMRCVLLGEPVDPETPEADLAYSRSPVHYGKTAWDVPMMLDAFVAAYDTADIVTGHYIRGFDLPTINGALLENGMRPLREKRSHDTKNDLISYQGLSKSQQNIGGMLGLRHPKVQMTQSDWRDANRLTPEGIERTRKRVVGDVRQHIEMRARLIDQGMVPQVRLWTCSTVPARYQP